MERRVGIDDHLSHWGRVVRWSSGGHAWIRLGLILVAVLMLPDWLAAQQAASGLSGGHFDRQPSSHASTPASRILWTEDCDPRTDPDHCSVGDPAILTPFYNVLAGLDASLTYHVPTSLAELAPYDVVLANFCSQGISAELVTLLKQYVATGGSIVVMGDNACVGIGPPWASSAAWATKLTQGWGITFTTDDDVDTQLFDPMVSHPITAGVQHLYSSRHAFLTLSKTARAVFEQDRNVFTALYEGAGTAIAIPDVGFHWLRSDAPTNDNFLFWHTMLHWLIQQSHAKRQTLIDVYLPLVAAASDYPGRISGKVTTADTGDGIKAWLNIFDSSWNFVLTTVTDDTGAFVTSQLPNGTYKIVVGPYTSGSSVYADQWYDNKPDFYAGDAVNVTAPHEVSGLDATIEPHHAVRGQCRQPVGAERTASEARRTACAVAAPVQYAR